MQCEKYLMIHVPVHIKTNLCQFSDFNAANAERKPTLTTEYNNCMLEATTFFFHFVRLPFLSVIENHSIE